MAPTELLAEQHANNFRNWFEPLGIEVGWLAGKQKGKARRAQQGGYRQRRGADDCRHPRHLPRSRCSLTAPALVIIDEQHRFGVHQRLALWEKRSAAGIPPASADHDRHADPPAPSAMTAYADLDTSIIDELPPRPNSGDHRRHPRHPAQRYYRPRAQRLYP